MKSKIVTLLAAVVTAGVLLAGPALAADHDGFYRNRWHAVEEWRQHHPYPVWGIPSWYPRTAYVYPHPSNWRPAPDSGWFHHDRD